MAGPTQEELQDGVSSIISSLLKLALAVRNPAPLDRYVKSGAIDMSYYKPHDLAYIEEMFPGIDDYLKERMAEATLQRRRFLEYSARHQCKLARDTEIKDDGDDNIDTLSIYASTNASSLPAPILHELSKLEAPDDVRSETSSLTSYASSGMGKRAKVPSPPSYAVLGSSEPFECPYCRLLIAPQDTYGWKRHVFNDLQPYVCTYQECQKQDQLYGSRHEWFDHELAVHRREWVCPGHCNEVFSSLKDFEAHVKTNYAQSDATSSLEVLTIACERPILPSASALCPFCLENVGTRKKIRNHIAQHLMEISLRVLPTSLEDSESSDSDSQPGDDRPKIAFPEVNHDFDVYKLIEWGKASKNLLTSDRRAFVDSLQQVKERLGEVEKLKRMTGVASGNLPNDNESINRAIDDAKESWNNIEKMISSTGTLAGETAGSQAPRESLELRCQQALLDPQIFATQVTALGKSLEAIETRLRISGTNAGPLNNALNDLIPRVVDWKNHDVYSFGKLLLYESSSLIINKSGAKPKTVSIYTTTPFLASN